MCNPQQQSPPQNTAWQGVYPDLSALNELFSTQQATSAANAGQPSPWIAFLASLGLQPISGSQNQQQQQARPEQEPSAPPAPESERREGQAYAGTNSAACPASSYSPPSTWCSPPLSSACPCPPCSQATCSTPPYPSFTPSAPSSSSCPACTSCMFEASP